jgi:phage terminase large subunit
MRMEIRLCRVAIDPNMTRRLFVDIGGTGRNADAFSMWGAQFIGREIRVHHYYEQVGQEIGHHLEWMRRHGYMEKNSAIWLPHDGSTHDKVFDVSYQSAFERAGYTVTVIPNQGRGAAMARVNSLRRMFPAIWMQHAEGVSDASTAPGLEALGWYHEKWDDERDIGLGPAHDWASHAADGAGLMAIVAEDAMQPGRGINRDQTIRRRGSAMSV